jgi:hypothetical protein
VSWEGAPGVWKGGALQPFRTSFSPGPRLPPASWPSWCLAPSTRQNMCVHRTRPQEIKYTATMGTSPSELCPAPIPSSVLGYKSRPDLERGRIRDATPEKPSPKASFPLSLKESGP